VNAEILAELDAERRVLGEPAGRGGVVRELAAEGSECRIVFSQLSAEDADAVIGEEMALARERGGTLEWKLYGHDAPADLDRRLLTAGFAADDLEQVLVLPVNEATLAAFGAPDCAVRRSMTRLAWPTTPRLPARSAARTQTRRSCSWPPSCWRRPTR